MGARLKALREKTGMTQQELAVKAGLSVNAVSKLEQAEKADPRLSTLELLAQGLDITVGQLANELTRKEKKK